MKRFALGLLTAVMVVSAVHGWNRLHTTDSNWAPGARGGARAADLAPHYRAGMDHMAAERYSDAYLEFTKAARLAPEDPRPLYQLGKVFEKLQFERRAEAVYRQALRIEPDYREAKLSLARVLCDFGKNDESAALLREVQENEPEDPLLWAELAANALRQGKAKEAVTLLERYVKAPEGTDRDWGLAYLGRAYFQTGRLAEAEEALRRSLALNPGMQLAHLWLGQLLIARGEQEAAERQLQVFRRIRDLSTEAHELQARLLRTPRHVPALLRLAEIRVRLGQPEQAIQAVNGALDVEPNNIQAIVQLAHCLTLLGQPSDAVRHLQRAVDLDPGNEKLRELYEKRLRALESQLRR